MKGTDTGSSYYDVPPSSESVTINGTVILRMRDGTVVEHRGGPHCMQASGWCGPSVRVPRVVGPVPGLILCPVSMRLDDLFEKAVIER